MLKDLDAEGKLFDAPKFEHDYPFCWRCDTPLIYYARESWFIKMTAVKDDLIRNNNTINWIPETIGTGRFGAWLETYRTGVSAVTDIGAHLLISGSVTSAVRCIQSEVLQSLKNFPITALMILSFTDHTLMQLLSHVNVAAQ